MMALRFYLLIALAVVGCHGLPSTSEDVVPEGHVDTPEDTEAINLHKQILVALHSSTATDADAEFNMPCGGCGFKCLQCFRNEIEGALRKAEELKNNLANKAQEVVNLAKELGNIKPVMESLGSCLAQMPTSATVITSAYCAKNSQYEGAAGTDSCYPISSQGPCDSENWCYWAAPPSSQPSSHGGKNPLDALAGLSGAFETGQVPKYVMDTWIDPSMRRVQNNVESAIPMVKHALEGEMKIFTDDGEIDEAVVAELPKKAFKLGTDLLKLDPVMKCLMGGVNERRKDNPDAGWGGIYVCPDGKEYEVGDNGDSCGSLKGTGGHMKTCNQQNGAWSGYSVTCSASILGKVEQLAELPVYKELFTWTIKQLQQLWKKIQPVLDAVLKFAADKFEQFINAFVPAKAELDRVVANAIDTACTGYSETLYDYIDAQDVDKKKVCAFKNDFVNNPAATITAVLTAVLTYASNEVLGLLNKHLYQPMVVNVIRILGQSQGSLMQMIDGLCGLIPEAGGPICMLLTVPLTNVAQQAFGELTTTSMNGLMTTAQSWVNTQIPKWSAAVATEVAQKIQQAKKVEVPSQVKVAVKEVSAQEKSLKPVLDVVQKHLMKAVEASFPAITKKVQSCDRSVKTLLGLVKNKLCAGEGGSVDEDSGSSTGDKKGGVVRDGVVRDGAVRDDSADEDSESSTGDEDGDSADEDNESSTDNEDGDSADEDSESSTGDEEGDSADEDSESSTGDEDGDSADEDQK